MSEFTPKELSRTRRARMLRTMATFSRPLRAQGLSRWRARLAARSVVWTLAVLDAIAPLYCWLYRLDEDLPKPA